MKDKYQERNTLFAIQPERYIVFSMPSYGRGYAYSMEEHNMELHGINFKRVTGCYKRQTEAAWIVNLKQWLKVLEVIPSIVQEKCVLALGAFNRIPGARTATLLYFGHKPPQDLGYFWPVTKAIALNCDAWTLDDGQYYIAAFTKPTPTRETPTRATWYGEEDNAILEARAQQHHKTRAYEIQENVNTAHKAPQGYFDANGKARTPSGHEF